MCAGLANVKERTVEQYLVAQVEAIGGIADKVHVVGKRGFFDRLVVLPGGKIILVECKRPRGGILREHQRRYASQYKALGVEVAIVRSREDIDALLR